MDNKNEALKSAIKQIEKQFGKGSIMRLGEEADRTLEAKLIRFFIFRCCLRNRWISKGRIIEIYGLNQVETTFALHAIAEMQNLEATQHLLMRACVDPNYKKFRCRR